METSSPSWFLSVKSGARTPFGISAPSKVSGRCSLSAPSTTAPRASTPTKSSATAMRGFTRGRLESQLVALPVHPPAPADDVLRARQLEADAPVQAPGRRQAAEGEQLEPLVAGRPRLVEHRL